MKNHLSYWLTAACMLISFTLTARPKKVKQPDAYTVWMQRGDSCKAAFDLFHAAGYYRQALQLKNTPDCKRALADICYKTGDYAQSIRMLQTLPSDSLVHADKRLLYFSYARLPQTDSMIVTGERIVRDYPYDSEIAASLASFYNKNEGAVRSVDILANYYQRDSSNVFVNKQLGYAYYLTKKYDEALRLFNKIREGGDRSFDICYLTGMTYYMTDKPASACKYLKEAAEISHFKNAESVCRLGIASIDLGQTRGYDTTYIYKGINYIEKAIELTEPQPQMMFSLYSKIAKGWLQVGEYEHSLEALQKCLEYKPDHAASLYKTAQVYGLIRNRKQEKDYYRRFLEVTGKTEENRSKFQTLRESAGKKLQLK